MDTIVRPFMIISERLWQSRVVPEDWEKANVILVFKKGKNEHLGDYSPVILNPWKDDGESHSWKPPLSMLMT
ncbi:hypothetical protein TURU_005185 [Turdus rufiventris]|nr:hypothetical protein TURU_005185 [Turdus rufiventris]